MLLFKAEKDNVREDDKVPAHSATILKPCQALSHDTLSFPPLFGVRYPLPQEDGTWNPPIMPSGIQLENKDSRDYRWMRIQRTVVTDIEYISADDRILDAIMRWASIQYMTHRSDCSPS